MAVTEFTDAVEIEGSQDISQLRVQGHTTQTEALQTWEDSDAVELAQISGDGRLLVGDDLGMATPDALIEAHRDSTSSRPNRAFHALGRVAGTLSDAVQWIVHELEILGSGAVNGLHSTLRVRLRQASTGDASEAELRAADIEAVNETGTAETRTGQITGLRAAVSNSSEGYVDQAVGLDVAVNNSNPDAEDDAINTAYGIRVGDVDQAGSNYALHTGAGTVHLGDVLEVPVRSDAPPGNPPADHYKVYFKEEEGDPRLYVKDETGAEKQVAGSGQANFFEHDMDLGSADQTVESGKVRMFGHGIFGSGTLTSSGVLQVEGLKLHSGALELPILDDHPDPPAAGKRALYRLREGIYGMDSAGNARLLSMYFPHAITLWPDEATVISGSGYTVAHNANMWGHWAYFTTSAVDDRVRWKHVLLWPGTWIVKLLGDQQTTHRGQGRIYVDGTIRLSFNQYHASVANNNQTHESSEFTVTDYGRVDVDLETYATGSGSPIVINRKITLKRIGD